MISTLCTYTKEEVEQHNTSSSCWVIYNNYVYDVTDFFDDHPGGGQVILDYAGKDMTEIFMDKLSHTHSENAIEILNEFIIGEIRTTGGGDDSIAHVNNFTLTDAVKDFKEENFLDLNKPLLEQMFFNNFTKEFYLQQVHKPRYTKESPRFLSSPLLEKLTLTDWYIVPLFWTPICLTFGYWANQELPLNLVFYLYLAGIFLFTLVEYVLHRFVFHLDDIVPDHPMFLFIHFVLHGVHHYIPMDRKRLVLPPILSSALGICLIKLIYALVPNRGYSNGLVGGAIIGYMAYDMMHYYIHHGHMFIDYFKIMKSYHMAHHHVNYSVGFGVTSKLWDYAFKTVLLPTTPSNIIIPSSSSHISPTSPPPTKPILS